LWGNIFIRVAALLVNLWEFVVGITPGTAGVAIAGSLVATLALIAVFASALRRA
jgi:hypothetical protein